MRAGAMAVLAALAAAIPAAAQTPGNGAVAPSPEMARFQQYVTSPDYLKSVETVVLGGEHDITPECKGAKALGRVGLVLFAMPKFKDGVAAPVAGAWKDRIRVDRCGSQVTHNVLIDVEPDGPHVGLLLPGDTDLPVPMQFRALQAGAEEAMKAGKCRDPNRVIVSNTRQDKVLEPVKADPKGILVAGKWREVWTFRACGKDQKVGMVFSADGKGSATFQASPAK
ncbi:MAG: hypothetical protein M0006_04445 [Magnetospirillum sp.]|nr:hypothetical protein [Magnetospirillum sp.]